MKVAQGDEGGHVVVKHDRVASQALSSAFEPPWLGLAEMGTNRLHEAVRAGVVMSCLLRRQATRLIVA